jgi:hypothetical protein
MAQEAPAAAPETQVNKRAEERQQRRPDADGGMRNIAFDENLMLLRLYNDTEMADTLKLSAEQKDALKKAAKELSERQIKLNEELRVASLEQAALAAKVMADKDLATDDLMLLVDKIGALRTEQAKLQTERLLVIRDTLTAEQIRQAGEVSRQRIEQMRQRGQQRRNAEARQGEGGPGQRGERNMQRGERNMQRGERGPRGDRAAQRGQRGANEGRKDTPLPQRPAGWEE